MNYEQSTGTTAGPDPAWRALSAVTTFPQWTSSMTEVRPLGSTPLAIGNRYRVSQPGLPAVVWEVTELTEGASFSWESRSPGVHTVAFHRVRPGADGATGIEIGIRVSGPLAGLLHLLIGGKTRRYLALEAAGLKAAAEAIAAQATA
jgi:Polyketide cyclase / dehydrase and lipid transport